MTRNSYGQSTLIMKIDHHTRPATPPAAPRGTTLNVAPIAQTHEERVRLIEQARELAA
jgi:hypothetical protein